MSRATTGWVVSGALGVATIGTAVLLTQTTGDAAPAAPRPAITVTPAAQTATPSATVTPTKRPTASPSTTKATASTSPSPVSPPTAETPD